MLLGASAMAGAALLAPDNTFRVIFMLYAGGFMTIGLTLWWFFFSGLSWKSRIGGGLAIIALFAVVSAGAVQRVEFTGDMRPRFRWRWQPNPKELTADWLKKQTASEMPQ